MAFYNWNEQCMYTFPMQINGLPVFILVLLFVGIILIKLHTLQSEIYIKIYSFYL